MSGSPRATAERLVERMTDAERARALRVDRILPVLRAAAPEADRTGVFPMSHVTLIREAGLFGLIIPEAYGGLGGGLRDLMGATYAMAQACPSTTLSFFFHCSSASRGLLALEALEAGLFTPEEAKPVKAFAEKVLNKMGREGKWLANFASETNKNAKTAITISTEAKKTKGGWLLTGEKSFGCATGVADEYLVTAKLEGTTTAEGMALFFVPRDAKGVRERVKWDAIGMRASATHGLIMEDVFIPETEALTVPGAFTRMMQMSRGSFVGNQAAAASAYLGGAQAVFDHTLSHITKNKFQDTGEPIGSSGFHQELIGKMRVDLETAYLWTRRQMELESSDPPLLPKDDVVAQWRMCKGEVTEAAFRVGLGALKCGGTSATMNDTPVARAVRDLIMGLVQAFPAERGRLEVAKMLVLGAGQPQFGVK